LRKQRLTYHPFRLFQEKRNINFLNTPQIFLKNGIEFAEPGGSLNAEKRGGLSGKFYGGATDLDR